MEFPIKERLDYERSVVWIKEYFHPDGFQCPNCNASVEQAREFRRTEISQLMVYRCRVCDAAYNLYTGDSLSATASHTHTGGAVDARDLQRREFKHAVSGARIRLQNSIGTPACHPSQCRSRTTGRTLTR